MLQSVLGISAATALPLPLDSAENKAAADSPAVEHPKLNLTMADAVSDGSPRFFDSDGLAALRRLGEILVPAHPHAPGAKEAEAAGFLDFLIHESPAERQALYRDGVARLNQEARSRHGKPFAEISESGANAILAPLREPWTYSGPSDPFARFLFAAKEDFLRATVNSRQWAMANSGRRSSAGLNTYWFTIE